MSEPKLRTKRSLAELDVLAFVQRVLSEAGHARSRAILSEELSAKRGDVHVRHSWLRDGERWYGDFFLSGGFLLQAMTTAHHPEAAALIRQQCAALEAGANG